ncbi:MAG: ISL3 family transposase [Candidatus Competibacterales bacterium]|nr:ISL3 family transposase [Candidatus Competibacterales bacterium]
MDTVGLFTAALGLQSPWEVAHVRFDPEAGEIHFDVACPSKRLACPACGAGDQPIHERKTRSWQHLHFFQYRAYLHVQVPRVACAGCGKTTQAEVPWARPQSGFTLLFEALVITLAQSMPVAQVARLLGVSDQRLWRLLNAVIEQARSREDFSGVERIGVDEKHLGRLGFISLFHDAGPRRRVLFGCAGRDASVFERFVDELKGHGGQLERIEAVTMDLSKAYQAGAREHLPQAVACFDGFHLIKLANAAVDEVRRAEVKQVSELKGTRWGTLKDAKDWTYGQICDMHWLTRSNLKTARAWRIKEALRKAIAQPGDDAERALKRWISWARRSRLLAFKRLGATIRDHLPGILNSLRLGLSNATAESINAKVQAAIARARGFRTGRCLMSVIYLIAGKLTHLPAPPYAQAAHRRE